MPRLNINPDRKVEIVKLKKCGKCGGEGHNARTCANRAVKPDTPAKPLPPAPPLQEAPVKSGTKSSNFSMDVAPAPVGELWVCEKCETVKVYLPVNYPSTGSCSCGRLLIRGDAER